MKKIRHFDLALFTENYPSPVNAKKRPFPHSEQEREADVSTKSSRLWMSAGEEDDGGEEEEEDMSLTRFTWIYPNLNASARHCQYFLKY